MSTTEYPRYLYLSSDDLLTSSQETKQKFQELSGRYCKCFIDCRREQSEEVIKKLNESEEAISHFLIDVVISSDGATAVPLEYD
jgi:hypothetical protein